jgi:1-acyl-sn-glycerol-3-phosphate acyltransferase
VVPLAVNGSHRVLSKGRVNLRPGTIDVAIGDPISTEDLDTDDREQLLETVRARLIDLHLQIGGAGGLDDPPPTSA